MTALCRLPTVSDESRGPATVAAPPAAAVVRGPQALCRLLGLEAAAARRGLCRRAIAAGAETLVKPETPARASQARARAEGEGGVHPGEADWGRARKGRA